MDLTDLIFIFITAGLILALVIMRRVNRRALDDSSNFVIYCPSTESVRRYEEKNRNDRRLFHFRARQARDKYHD